MQATSWRHGVTSYQWLVLVVAWLGWVFDSMDSTIYALVLHPAPHDLLHAQTGGTVNFGNHTSSLITNGLTGFPVTIPGTA